MVPPMSTTSDYYDSLYGHPVLPTGYNSTDNDGDEVDGPGVNGPIIPIYADTFEPLVVMIITEEMLEVFDGCADYVVAPVNDTVVIRPVNDTMVIRRAA